MSVVAIFWPTVVLMVNSSCPEYHASLMGLPFSFSHMRTTVKDCAFVLAVTVVCSTLILLFAQGRIFQDALLTGPLAKPVDDGCYIASLPGVMLAVAIWGYSSNRTVLSDALVVAVNGTLYAVPFILIIRAVRYWRTRRKP